MIGYELQTPSKGTAACVPYVALPLRALPAWRAYLGLPMLGSRLPEGGLEEFFRLFREDMVLSVFEPVIDAAVTYCISLFWIEVRSPHGL